MRWLDLDFERRPRPQAASYLLLLAGGAFASIVATQYQDVSGELEAQRESLRQVQSGPRQAAGSVPRSAKQQDERMAAARVVLSHLTVPWETLFRGLESVDEKDVALLSMIPDAEKQQIKLTLEAKNLNAMLSYHRKLQENPTFKEVSLGEHEIVQQDPYRPVRFSVTATWVIKGYASK